MSATRTALLLLLAACAAPAPAPGPDVAARLAGTDIRYAEFERHLERHLGEGGGALESEALSELLDQFLDERLLQRLAVERGLVPPGAGDARAADALLGAMPLRPPSEAEISAWYELHRAEFAHPERVEIDQLNAPDRLAAERARREVLAGADWDTVAARLAAELGSEPLGGRAVFRRDELPPAFAEVVFALPEGGVSPVVASEFGFLVFRVVRRLPPGEEPLVAVGREIRSRLLTERADAALAALVAEARSRYAVTVLDRNLPFVYQGSYPISRPYEKTR